MKFACIVADPAWGFDDGLKKMKRSTKRSATSQYRVMTPAQIAALPVKELADPAGAYSLCGFPAACWPMG